MITIDLLKNHPNAISDLSHIWYDVLGKIWAPEIMIEQIKEKFSTHLNDQSLPLTFIAFDNDISVGMCSLRENDGIISNLTPWLGSLVVHKDYQKRGIGKMLMEHTKKQAKFFGFNKLYLFTHKSEVPYYAKLGWRVTNFDNFKEDDVTVMEIDI